MDQVQKSLYEVILGTNPLDFKPGMTKVVVSHMLPKSGEHGFRWVNAEVIGKEYGHYGFRLHPKANSVNVHVYGDVNLIGRMAAIGRSVVCELELVKKTLASGRTFILVNLYLTKPFARVTHTLRFVATPKNCMPDIYTTADMRGVGIKVVPLV